jgi:DNA repair protein RadC
LPGVLAAARPAQDKILSDRPEIASFLATVYRAMVHALRTETVAGPVLSNPQTLIDYLRLDSAHSTVERFRVLFLNAQNRLLDEFAQDGTVNEAPVYPREIMRRALDTGATALVLAHNHPSGDPRPSERDISVTRRVADAAAALGILVHDHLIVSRSGWTSFRALGLL